MEEQWIRNRFRRRTAVFTAVLLIHHFMSLSSCLSLNSEGLALLKFKERVVRDPFGALSNWNDDWDFCSWFGVECSHGKIVSMNLRDLCLDGTLGPELGTLSYMKSIILRNNSLFGTIPNEIGELKELEVLDLGYNNFSGPFPSNFYDYMSLTTLLLDNNEFLGSISPELYELKMLSEFQIDENQLTNTARGVSCSCGAITWNTVQARDMAHKRKLQVEDTLNPSKAKMTKDDRRGSKSSTSLSLPSLSPPYLFSSPSPPDPPFFSSEPSDSPSPSPIESPGYSPEASSPGIFSVPSPSPVEAPTPSSLAPAYPPPVFVSTPPESTGSPNLAPASNPSQIENKRSNPKHHKILIWAGIAGGLSVIFISAIGIFFLKRTKVDTIKPVATGLSGQLQKAFISGVPQLKRSELEAACEDFSNIIGSFSNGTIYKGTLSSGVEIAVTSSGVTSSVGWSKTLESQFREKISTLSKVNHKNFVNLIGYCEDEDPFTRMMVFEYAPNGTLFEHLHVTEAEHLDWGMRLRIAMGIAYCLEHMHQLMPPITVRNLQSSSVYLTEDYAAKISNFSFWNVPNAAKKGPNSTEILEAQSAYPEGNVYSFGVILFEMITGRIPYLVDTESVADWVHNYKRGERSLVEMVDPTLNFFQEDVIEKLVGVISDCVNSNPKQRLEMKEITARLKEITAMGPDAVSPKLSPLWWAELEIMSTDGS